MGCAIFVSTALWTAGHVAYLSA